MRIFSTTRRKLLTTAVVAGVILVPVLGLGMRAHAGFGPDRPTFTWANPAPYITFNSITDNPDPSIGDERNFVGARDSASADKLTYSQNVTVSDNEELVVRVFFHNNAASNLNLVAANTTAKLALPGSAATSQSISGDISASNATPVDVTSTMALSGSTPFTLAYEPGSAQLWTQYVTGTAVSDNIVTSGALIGSGGTDGFVPGCSQFSGYVTVKVRVHFQAPVVTFACSGLDVAEVDRTHFNFTAHATVSNANVTSYTFTAKNSGGNVVDTKTVSTSALSAQYAFNQTNPDTYTVSAVVNTDHGSTDPAQCTKQVTVQAQTPNPTFACTGLDVANVDRTHYDLTAHGSASNANITSYAFTTKDSNGNVVDTQTVNTSATSAVYHFNQSTAGTYTVSAVVNTDHGSTNAGDCTKQITVQPQTPNPVFACSALNVTTAANRAITATVTPVAQNGATLQSVNYDFGDGTTLMTDQTSANHTYAKDGTYTVAATLTFNVGSTSQTARCSQSVTITTPVTPPVTPPVVTPPATTLPNTGPGDDVAALFAGTTALGAAGHYIAASRRNRR